MGDRDGEEEGWCWEKEIRDFTPGRGGEDWVLEGLLVRVCLVRKTV